MLLPEVNLAVGASLETAIKVIEEQHNNLINLRSGNADQRLSAYQDWAVGASDALRHVLSFADVQSIVETSTYLQLMPRTEGGTNPLLVNGLLNAEQADRRRCFERLLATLKQVKTRVDDLPWSHGPSVLVPDTNIYLHHEDMIDRIDWRGLIPTSDQVRVVVPMVVVRELDRHKRAPSNKTVSRTNKEAVRDRARRSARALGNLFEQPMDVVTLEPRRVTIELLLDHVGHVAFNDPDTEFIERVAAFKALTARNVAIVTSDNGMKFSSAVRGLDVIRL